MTENPARKAALLLGDADMMKVLAVAALALSLAGCAGKPEYSNWQPSEKGMPLCDEYGVYLQGGCTSRVAVTRQHHLNGSVHHRSAVGN